VANKYIAGGCVEPVIIDGIRKTERLKMDLNAQYIKEQEQVARVPQYKKDKAVDFLKAHFTEEEKGQLKNIYEHSGSAYWFSGYHFTTGMTIRNVLRENGYGEDYFGIDNLDYIYCHLLEMVIAMHGEVEHDIPKIRKIRV